MFLDGVTDTLAVLRPLVEKVASEPFDSDEAVELVQLGVELERLAVALRTTAARRVDSRRWQAAGFRSAAAWMAAIAGTPVGPAITALETLHLLDDLPATAAAFRTGLLSLAQVTEIADVASEWPDAEQQLLDAAEVLSLNDLRDECRRVRVARTDAEDRYRRIRRGRYVRSWTDREGAVCLSARLTPDEGAQLLTELDGRCREIAGEAKAGGWFESLDAHRADALIDLACTAAGGTPAGPQATVHVWVDYEALVRGHTEGEEQCEIPGIGPIPVSAARRMASDAYLKILLAKGVDIVAVAHAGRTIPAHLRTALERRDPTCIVPGCDQRHRLQIDHKTPVAAGGITRLENLARLCPYHHYLKSHEGYRYRGGPGRWGWIPPETPGPDPPPL